MPEPELDRLSNIVQDVQRSVRQHRVDGRRQGAAAHHGGDPAKVAADKAYQNARKNNDRQNARIEHDKALARVMTGVLKDDTELFKQFSDNEGFKKWLSDSVFPLTYEESA